MTTFNTGNPIGSTDSRDRLDNSENADILENSTSLRYHADRLGTVRKTRYGMQKEHDDQIAAHNNEFNSQLSAQNAEHNDQIAAHENEFDTKIATYDNEFDAHISGMAISNVGTFSAGYTLTNIRQSLRYAVDGYEYSWSGTFPKVVPAGSTPATSGGIGINAWVVASIGASIATPAQTNSRLSLNQVVSPAGLNAVVPYAPTVNPTLDLDFAKQKYRWYAGAAGLTESSTPSLMTFSRSSIATFFDAMGVMRNAAVDTPRIDYDPATGECKGLLIEESRTNFMNYSSRLSNEVWAIQNAGLKPSLMAAPDGTLTAWELTATVGGSGVYRSFAASASTAYTYSAYVKAGTSSNVQLKCNSAGVQNYITFDLLSGTVLSATDATKASITPIGNGVYRISGLAISTSSGTGYFELVVPTLGLSVHVADTQLEAGYFPTSYIPSADTWTARASTATYLDSNGVLQTAASGVARSAAYDYDADGVLRPIGLLLEAAATNLLLYSEQFDNAAWNKSACSVTANATTAPDGNTTADKIVEDTSTAQHYIYQSQSAAASTAYTYSIHVKAAERTSFMLATYDGTTTLTAVFNLSTASITSVDSGASASIKKTGNGAYRCSITVTSGAGATSIRGTTYLHNGTSLTYAGDGTSGIYAWGAQLGTGNYATSYIATTSAQVTRVADTSASAQTTRAADSAVISGANFSQWYKQYEGAVLLESVNPTTRTVDSSSVDRGGAVISDSTDTNRIRVSGDAGITVSIRKGGTDQSLQTVGSVSVGKHKTALSFVANNINAAIDAVSATQDVSAAIPYLTQLNIGKGAIAGGVWNGHIRSLKYYPKALTSTELQSMTA